MKELLEPYLMAILEKLHLLLQSHIKLVQEQAVTTIATVADSAQEKFVPFYGTFVPILKQILQNTPFNEHQMLRGKAMECVSLIGLAVGPELFRADAPDIMQVLHNTQQQQLDDDDPQISYMLSAWARICKVIGKEFVPYLGVVMPPLLKSAKLNPDVRYIDEDDEEDINQIESEGWDCITIPSSSKTIGIKTSTLEEKCTACEMLVCYAKELKEGFAQYVHEVLSIMVPLLKFYLHEGVRIAAAASLPVLLESIKEAGANEQDLLNAWQYVIEGVMPGAQRTAADDDGGLIAVLAAEPDIDVVRSLLEGFTQCLLVIGQPCLSAAHLALLSKGLMEQLKNYFDRSRARAEERQDPDYDDEVGEVLEAADDADDYVLQGIAEVMHALFKTHRTVVLPFFEELLPIFQQMLTPERPPSDRQWALCIFDDVIEFCGEHSGKYLSSFGQAILDGAVDKDTEVRMPSVYGLGLAAQHGGAALAPLITEGIPRLVQVIQSPEARTKEMVGCTETAISSLGKIIKYSSVAQPIRGDLLALWLNALPITNDEEEGPFVYDFLCELIEKNDAAILGEQNKNLPKIAEVLATVVGSEMVSEERNGTVVSLLQQIRTSASAALEQVFTQLPKVQQDRLQQIFSS